MNNQKALKLITQKYPSQDILWIDKGQMNFIAVVDQRYVYKFPKNSGDFRLLAKEHAIYELLGSSTTLNIPRSIELNDKQQYLKLSYVAGKTLALQEAVGLTNDQKIDLAEKLSIFIKELNSPTTKSGFDGVFETDTNDFYYVENWLKKIAEYCYGKTDELCIKYVELYKQFSDALPYGFCVGDLIAHKDLHEDNMLFNEKNELVGIIDFAEVRYTSIYSELRTVMRFGVDVVDEILKQLDSLGGDAKTSDVLLFARVYEMAIIIQGKYIKKELPWRVSQAEFYLKQWGEI